MPERSRVVLPPGVSEPFEVYLNGVLQTSGGDYVVFGRELVFSKPLATEGRLGTMRWLGILLGIAGTYRKNDSVDVVYKAGGRRTVASNLSIVAPESPGGARP